MAKLDYIEKMFWRPREHIQYHLSLITYLSKRGGSDGVAPFKSLIKREDLESTHRDMHFYKDIQFGLGYFTSTN